MTVVGWGARTELGGRLLGIIWDGVGDNDGVGLGALTELGGRVLGIIWDGVADNGGGGRGV